MKHAVLALVLAACGSRTPSKPEPAATPPAPDGWLKGQTHVHSANSGDSQTPPADVVRWYAARGYDFIVFTDHERITTEPGTAGMLTFPGVELTQNLRECDPPPEPGFGCLLHINALFADRTAYEYPPAESASRLDLYTRALTVSKELGAVAQLNHPNFHFAADAPLIAELGRRGLALVEIANLSEDSMDAGDATHPDTETLWNQVLDQGVLVFGVATDDAHHYDDADAVRAAGRPAFTGDKGWIMVRAAKNPADIEKSVRSGDFYSTTGALLTRVTRGNPYLVEVAPTVEDPTIRFIGPGGEVLDERRTHSAEFRFTGAWIRAVVVDAGGRKAWTQPAVAP